MTNRRSGRTSSRWQSNRVPRRRRVPASLCHAGLTVNHKVLLSNYVHALRYSVLFLTIALRVNRRFRTVATIASMRGSKSHSASQSAGGCGSTIDDAAAWPAYPEHVWACDFVKGQTYNRRKFRILTIIDKATRQCLAHPGARQRKREHVLAALADLFIAPSTSQYPVLQWSRIHRDSPSASHR